MLKTMNLDKVFQKIIQAGGDFAEVFAEHSTSNQIFLEDRKIDRIQSGVDAGIGLRVIFGHQSVYGYTNDLTIQGLLDLADTLCKAIQKKSKSELLNTVVWTGVRPSFHQEILKKPAMLSLKEKLQYVERANGAAWKTCSHLKQVTAAYVETNRKIEIANSLGHLAQDEKQYLTFFAELVGEKNGQMQTSYEAEGGFLGLELFEEHPPERIVEKAVKRLEVLLDAKPAPAGLMPVVLAAEAGGTMVHEAVGHGLEADLACNGLSVYKDKIGERVASSLVNIIDDGTMPLKRGSYAVDDEGTPSQQNILIENGILKKYMSDRLSHVKFGIPLTGNGRRESYKHKPIVRMTNTYLAAGNDDPAKILAETKKGLYVRSMGGGQVNTVTGDFVFAVTEGYLIHDGEIGPAVKGATLTGNGPQVMQTVDRVGSDLGFAIGTCGKDSQRAPVTDAQPTIRIPEIIVGGEVAMSEYWKSSS